MKPFLLRLYQATGGAPLTIKWAVGQIKQKEQSLDTVLTALHEAKGDIFEEIFVRSWSLLSEDAKKVWDESVQFKHQALQRLDYFLEFASNYGE